MARKNTQCKPILFYESLLWNFYLLFIHDFPHLRVFFSTQFCALEKNNLCVIQPPKSLGTNLLTPCGTKLFQTLLLTLFKMPILQRATSSTYRPTYIECSAPFLGLLEAPTVVAGRKRGSANLPDYFILTYLILQDATVFTIRKSQKLLI